MCRKPMFLVFIVSLLVPAGGASAADLTVPAGTIVTKSTSQSYDKFVVEGRLIVQDGANLSFSNDSHIDGMETGGIRPEIIMNGGSFFVDARTNMGTDKVDNGGNYAYLTMNGGTFTCTDTFKFPDDKGGEHRIYLNGGIMHSGDIQMFHDRDAIIYVGAGILRLNTVIPGSSEYDPAEWVNQGALLPAEGYDEVVIEYIPAGPYTEVRATRPDPNLASNPSPPDWGAVFDTEATLSWTPGENADKHDIYFGTDYDDVNNAANPNEPPGRGRQDSNSYDVCDLELGKTYYWRIDEVNGPTMWKGNVWRFTAVDGYINSFGMRFIGIEPGTFQMGGDDGEWDERPVHKVTISRKFYIQETEVSTAQYQLFDPTYTGSGEATGISWHDANAFAEWLSQLEGKSYRLPTEAEWEYVCRAGTTTPYSSGGSQPSEGTPNPWGVMNMHNSPREWVWDWHGEYSYEDQSDPIGPEQGFARVVRGGGLDNGNSYYYRSSNRAGIAPGFAGGDHDIGFRLVLVQTPMTPPQPYQAPFTRQCIKQGGVHVLQSYDPDEPYFNQRPMLPIPPDNASRDEIDSAGLHPSFRGHNHSPGMEVCPNGDVLMIIYTSYSEYEEGVSLMAARLRFGALQWDMPTPMFDFPGTNDHAPMLWNDDGTLHFFWGCPELPGGNPNPYPFQWTSSDDSGATWDEVKFPDFIGSIGSHSRQPINSALRNGNTIYVSSDGSGGESVLWKSDDNGQTWYDTGGRTYGRHTTFVFLNNGDILGMGGKNTDYNGTKYMPKSISDDGAVSWTESSTPFNWLGSNQRPCIVRLGSGNLFFCSDYQKSFSCDQAAGITEYGSLVALSDDEGQNWTIKKIPTALPHECLCWDCGNVGTLGYSVARQALNGIIHVISTMNHPCQHFEFNEKWILEPDAGADLPPDPGESGTVNYYQENYPGGGTRATWSAKTCDDGRYLLHGTETWYYEGGQKQYEVTYYNGHKVGTEAYWGPDGVKQWSWEHDEPDDTSVWTQWWPNGLKHVESRWRYGGMVAHGDTYFWDWCGAPEAAWNFSDGDRTGPAALPPPQVRDADLTDDGFVNYSDLKVFTDNWLLAGPAGYNIADLNCDGNVKFDDYATLALQWLESYP